MSGNSNKLLQHLDAYTEYSRIVGEDDNGIMFDESQFKAYKEKVAPMRLNNRIYTSYSNKDGIECIEIGPQSLCFCQHRYIQHKTDFEKLPIERPIKQPCKKCKCNSFRLMPKFTGALPRCHCKHELTGHSIVRPNKCNKVNCKCIEFKTSAMCLCGAPDYEHFMLTESKEERKNKGKPIGESTVYQAMGGLTGFNSLTPGKIRMENTGTGGTLDQEKLNAPISSSDHPFIKAYTNIFNQESSSSENRMM